MSPSDRLAQINRATAGQLALCLLGISLVIASPSAALPSGTSFELADGGPRENVPENASVIACQDLSSDTQDTFRRALESDDNRTQIQGDADIDALYDYDYIRYQGEYYEFYLVAIDRAGSARVFLVAGAGVIAILAAAVWRIGAA